MRKKLSFSALEAIGDKAAEVNHRAWQSGIPTDEFDTLEFLHLVFGFVGYELHVISAAYTHRLKELN